MEITTRRKFCGTAILAFPALAFIGKAKAIDIDDSPASSDPIFNSLADEFTRITIDGAQNGFKAEHFRRYAGFMRVFDAQMESKGINRETDKKLDEDDFYKLNPIRSARSISDFWRKRKVEIREDELIERLAMDWKTYREWKKAIKKQGGIRALHARVAEAFEQKAKAYETSALRNGPFIRQGRIEFPRQEEQAIFMKAQYEDPDRLIREFIFEGATITLPIAGEILDVVRFIATNINFDCLCRAMIVEASLLSLAFLTTLCLPCGAPAATLLAVEKLMEGIGVCSPTKC